ncbi:hypothetical protein V8F33_013349, partial [Rhypophila sp. PSN 637]
LALLRVAPVLSVTVSLKFTFCEYTFVRPSVASNQATKVKAGSDQRDHVNYILPSFIARFVPRGMSIILTTYPLNIATAIANVTRCTDDRTKPRITAVFYITGTVFSMLHFPFGTKSIPYLESVRRATVGRDCGVIGRIPRKDEAAGKRTSDNTALIESWLRLNVARGAMADFPAWVS